MRALVFLAPLASPLLPEAQPLPKAQPPPEARAPLAPNPFRAEGTVLYEFRDLGPDGLRGGAITAAYRVDGEGRARHVDLQLGVSLRSGHPVTRSADTVLTAAAPHDRFGWLVVNAAPEIEVSVRPTDRTPVGVGRAPAWLLLSPGPYTVRLSSGTGSEEDHEVQVFSRREVRVQSDLAAAPAPEDAGAQRASPAREMAREERRTREGLRDQEPTQTQETPPRRQTRAAPPSPVRSPPPARPPSPPDTSWIAVWRSGIGGETAPGVPLSGWRMQASTLSPDPSPSRGTAFQVAERPFDSEAEDLSSAQATSSAPEPTSAPNENTRGCPALSPHLVRQQALAHIDRAEYLTALACLNQFLLSEPENLEIVNLRERVRYSHQATDGLPEEQRAVIASLREEMLADSTGDVEGRIERGEQILSYVPGDIAALRALLTIGVSRAPGDGPPLGFAYVPSSSAASTYESARTAVGSPPPRGYFLKTVEVTNAQFAHFLNVWPPERRPPFSFLETEDAAGLELSGPPDRPWRPKPGMENFPVVDATWHGADAYARWAGGRLPTRSEWRWAYVLGDNASGDANLSGAGQLELRPVASGQPDALGLYDLVGNAWEWLGERPPSNPNAQDQDQPQLRYAAGGSFTTSRSVVVDKPFMTTDEKNPNGHVGFRVLLPFRP